MASGNRLVESQQIIDYQATFGYPAGAFVVSAPKSDLGEYHQIVYVGSPVGIFANAPNGSSCEDPTNHHRYTKTGAIGSGIGGAWVVNS
jgi:hypothetical protein